MKSSECGIDLMLPAVMLRVKVLRKRIKNRMWSVRGLHLQAGIDAVEFEQLCMSADFLDVPVFEHGNPVRVADGGKAVRHHEGGAALHQPRERFLDQGLR